MKFNYLSIISCIGIASIMGSSCTSDDTNKFDKENERPLIDLSASEVTLAKDQHNFQIDMFADVVATSAGQDFETFSFSPVSATMALSILANVTDSENANLVCSMMDCKNLQELNNYNSKLMDYLPYKGKRAELNLQNGFWYDYNQTINPFFDKMFKDVFKSSPEPLDFNNDACTIINNWSDRVTNGIIKRVVFPSNIAPDDKVFFANVLYYKGVWDIPFDSKNTVTKDFHGATGTTRVSMMKQTNHFKYSEVNGTQLLELPFSGDHNSMYVILPDEKTDIVDFCKKFDSKVFNELIAGMDEYSVTVRMPKFKTGTLFIMSDYLESKGISTTQFPMTGLGFNDSFPYEMMQQCAIEVDENGTVMAAATSGMYPISPSAPKFAEFNVNRPFIYIVEEKTSGTVLMMGIIRDLK